MNSLKMKVSVLIGVTQMLFGLMLRLSNCLFEKNQIDLWCEWAPMIVFLLSFFGYMNYMILYKVRKFQYDSKIKK
jgi:V-type H+-transporting ATPase subunit a